MGVYTIYHNPRCSKSRQTLALLRNNGIEPTIVEYLKAPPNADVIASIHLAVACPIDALVRKKESIFRELGLGAQELTDTDWYAILADYPSMLERPIVVSGERAAIGRPPESVLTLLD